MNDSGKGAGANSIPGINYSCVKEFTDIFEQQYDNLLAMGMLSEDSRKLEKYLDQFVSQGEYNHKEDQPFSKLLLTNLLDLTIIKPIVESCCGYDLITEEDLTDMERSLKLVFAIVDLITLATGLYGFTLAAETMGAKEAVAYFARLAMVELAADVSATTVATIGEYCEWPAGLTILLSLGTGLTVGRVGNHLIFKQNGIEIFSKEVSESGGLLDDYLALNKVEYDDVLALSKRVNEGGSGALPQGISQEQFDEASKLLRDSVGDISDDIVVQGSRASGTAKPTSDIDIAIKVTPEKFDELINQYFKTPNPGSAKERTMLHAIETGKIQAGEAKLSGLRKLLQEIFGMDVDVSIICEGGIFDNPPFIPFK